MRRIGIAGAALVLMLAGAGCGGSNDAANDAAGEDTITEESTSTGTSASTEEVSTEGTTDTVDNVGGLSGECKDLVDASQAFGAAVSSSLGSGDSGLGEIADLYKAFADNAPDDLKDDFETLADVMAGYANALADLDLQAGETPSADQIAELTKLGQSLSTAEVQQATEAISTWTEENCGPNP
jgi:hypothetical protein